jgi:hypothetical protein
MKKEKISIIAIGLILSLLSPITQSQEETSETRKEKLTEKETRGHTLRLT